MFRMDLVTVGSFYMSQSSTLILSFYIKFRYCEKATKFKKNQVFLKLLKNVKTKFKIFLLFGAFSEYPNFNWKDRNKIEDLCRFTQTTNS